MRSYKHLLRSVLNVIFAAAIMSCQLEALAAEDHAITSPADDLPAYEDFVFEHSITGDLFRIGMPADEAIGRLGSPSSTETVQTIEGKPEYDSLIARYGANGSGFSVIYDRGERLVREIRSTRSTMMPASALAPYLSSRRDVMEAAGEPPGQSRYEEIERLYYFIDAPGAEDLRWFLRLDLSNGVVVELSIANTTRPPDQPTTPT